MRKLVFLLLVLTFVSLTLYSCNGITGEIDTSTVSSSGHEPFPCIDENGDQICDVCNKAIQTNTSNTTSSSYTPPVFDSPDDYNDPSGSAFYITFVCNGGNQLNPMRAEKDGNATIQYSPSTYKNGSNFVGWYKSPDFNESSRISFPYLITATETWYAKWEDVVNYQNLHSSISWSSTTIFDMRTEQSLGIGKTITVPSGVNTIHLIGNYNSDSSHIFKNLSFEILQRSGSIQFIFEDFAFISYTNKPAIFGTNVDIVVTSKGSTNMVCGANGSSGSDGADGYNDQVSPTSGASGSNGTNGSCAISCNSLRISGEAAISFVGGNGGNGGDGGNGGNITSTKYSGVPSCGHGGRGGNGGNGASGVIVTQLVVVSNNVTFFAGNGGHGGNGGRGGNGVFNLVHWCDGGDGGNGGNGGSTPAPVSATNQDTSFTYNINFGSAGNGGSGGSAGVGNGNGYGTAIDHHYGENGSNGYNGSSASH